MFPGSEREVPFLRLSKVAEGDHRYPPDPARCDRGHANGKRQIALLPVARRDIITQLGLRQPVAFVAGFDRPNLRFQVRKVEGEKDKIDAIMSLLKKEARRGIIYAATRKNVEALTLALRSNGYQCGKLSRRHGDGVPQVCPGSFYGGKPAGRGGDERLWHGHR